MFKRKCNADAGGSLASHFAGDSTTSPVLLPMEPLATAVDNPGDRLLLLLTDLLVFRQRIVPEVVVLFQKFSTTVATGGSALLVCLL